MWSKRFLAKKTRLPVPENRPLPPRKPPMSWPWNCCRGTPKPLKSLLMRNPPTIPSKNRSWTKSGTERWQKAPARNAKPRKNLPPLGPIPQNNRIKSPHGKKPLPTRSRWKPNGGRNRKRHASGRNSNWRKLWEFLILLRNPSSSRSPSPNRLWKTGRNGSIDGSPKPGPK